MAQLPNPPSMVSCNGCRFLIMDAPTDNNLYLYVKELKLQDIRVIVRTCEATYSKEKLPEDIQLEELAFPDGEPPSDKIIQKWLRIVENENKKEGRPVAVHCVAGLGRSPVLVAIALIELANLSPWRAIEEVRLARRGALTLRQANWLSKYQTRKANRCNECVFL